LSKLVNKYWNSVALDGNPWTWSNTRNRMQTPKFKIVSVSISSWIEIWWFSEEGVWHNCRIYGLCQSSRIPVTRKHHAQTKSIRFRPHVTGGSHTLWGSAHPREYNWGATWKKK
jgi:hypothetical protein